MADQPLPAKYPTRGKLKLYRGDTREIQVTFPDTYDVDFTTGHTFLSQVRAEQSRDGTLLATFTVTAPAARTLNLLLPASEADGLVAESGKTPYWDVQVTKTSTGVVKTWLANDVEIEGDGSHG